MRRIAVAAGVVLLGFAAAVRAEPEKPAGSDLSRTDVVLTTGAPIRAGRNALWCATGQLAWDALADVAGKDGKLALGEPAPSDVVEALNRRSFPHDAVDEGATVVVSGFGRDGVVERIGKALAGKFGPGAKPATPLVLGPDDAVGFAWLEKDLPFETPFQVHEVPMAFSGGEARVRAFGLREGDVSVRASRIACQATAWLAPEPLTPAERLTRPAPVVELGPKGGADRILLSAIEPGTTLEETWAKTADRLAAGRGVALEAGAHLEVPGIEVDAAHRFREWEGATIAGGTGGRLAELSQRVRLTLSERGAAVRSEATVALPPGDPLRAVFDRPFLLALLRKGAARPWLLLWVGNDDLLAKIRVESVDAKALESLVGAWRIDVDATLEGFVSAMLVDVPAEGVPDKDDPAKRVTREQFAEEMRTTIRERWKMEGGAEVGADGSFSMTLSRNETEGEGVLPGRTTMRMRGSLKLVDGSLAVLATEVDGKPASGRDKAPVALRLENGRLRLVGPGDAPAAIVLKRP